MNRASMNTDVVPISREHNPFPRTGVVADPVPRFQELPTSLVALLKAHVDAAPDVEAVVELDGERLTYGELWDRAARVAGGLRTQGVRRGTRVAVRYPAGVRWVVAFWGILMAGGIVVAVNTRSAAPEIDLVRDDAGVVVDLAPDTPLPDGEPMVADDLTRDDIAALFYTSGTTGRPKGVPTTHEAFLTNATNMVRCLGLDPEMGAEMRTLISVPLFHVTGCNSQMLVATQVGGTAVIMPVLDQARLLSCLAEERITFMVTVPAVYNLVLRHPDFGRSDVSTVRFAAYGGAPIAPSLVAGIQEAFPDAKVVNGYGMTETASLMTVLPHEEAVAHADSVGYAVPSVDLGVVPLDPADPTVGELVSRGANVVRSYWNRPDADADAIVDGWLHTGDIVRVDEAGRIHIIDRTKDIIIRGGENVSSVEVEGILTSAPGVLDAAVLAVPDDVMGEKVGALLHADDEEIDVGAVLEHCARNLAGFKVPQYVAVTAEPLPRNAGGKLLKSVLRGRVSWGDPLR